MLFTGLPSFAPAISFLKGAGQGHIVNQVKVVLEVFVCFIHPKTASLVSGGLNRI